MNQYKPLPIKSDAERIKDIADVALKLSCSVVGSEADFYYRGKIVGLWFELHERDYDSCERFYAEGRAIVTGHPKPKWY